MRKIFVFCSAWLFLVSWGGWAQDQATIVGTVADSTGAVIPGAKITVSNPDKGYVRNLVTNSEGAYQAPALPIGEYVVTAEVSGFRKLTRSGIAYPLKSHHKPVRTLGP
jgi:hypothetical protein